jgi:hypothetical protein
MPLLQHYHQEVVSQDFIQALQHALLVVMPIVYIAMP